MAKRKNHPGSIEKRGPSYRVRLCVDGERSYHTLKGATKKEAREFAREKHRELKERAKKREQGLPTDVRLSDLLDRYEEDELPTLSEGSQRSYRDSLKPIRAHFVDERDDPRLDEIRAGDVSRYLSWRRVHTPSGEERDAPLSGRTLEKDRSILHRIFELAVRWELVDANPVARTEPPQKDTRDPVILSDEQYERLLEAAEERSPMLGAYVTFLGETGARCESEALWTRWEDIDLEDGFVWLDSDRDDHRTKTGEGRYVPLTPRLEERLREHAARFRMRTYDGERSPWLFHHPRTIRNVEGGDRFKSMRHSFNRAVEAVNDADDDVRIPEGFRQHDLRHRRVTSWLADGKSPALVQEAMGHATIQTTLKYTHLAKGHLRALVEEERGERERLASLRG